jgi:hypothetical protein
MDPRLWQRCRASASVLCLLLSACGSDAPQDPAGVYSCDSVSPTSGHTCFGGSYASGQLEGTEEALCDTDKGSGSGFAKRACPVPKAGCVCSFVIPEHDTTPTLDATEVFYFSSASLATDDAKQNAFIGASVWCSTIAIRLPSPEHALTCYGLGAPLDGEHR